MPTRNKIAVSLVGGDASRGEVLELGAGGLCGVFSDFSSSAGGEVQLVLEAPPHRLLLDRVAVEQVTSAGDKHLVVFTVKDDSWPAARRLFEGDGALPMLPDSFRTKQPSAIPRIPGRRRYTREAWHQRIEWLTQFCGTRFQYLTMVTFSPEEVKGNIENFIGNVHVPVAAAGPLLFTGQNTNGYVVAPFATTEGALVSSASRGATAVSRSGGVYARVLDQKISRAPLFVLKDVDEAVRLSNWLVEHLAQAREVVRQASRHAELTSISPIQNGNVLHARFIYTTGDAAGQNMTTVCTWSVCQWIRREAKRAGIQIEDYFIEGNMSGDKKVTFANFTLGRGIKVTAEAVIADEEIRRVLHVDPDRLVYLFNIGSIGSHHAGMVGGNVNVANAVAAIFTATGQDIGCVHESALGLFSLRRRPGGVYASMLLPTLMIGTVGGGTSLPTQRECLKMLGCYGSKGVVRFAEIIAGFCLALDLSTLAAVVSDDFAMAHEAFGRRRPRAGLRDEQLGPELFARALKAGGEAQDGSIEVIDVQPFYLEMSSSILSDLGIDVSNRRIGHLPFRVRWRQDGVDRVTKLVVKSKATDEEIISISEAMARIIGGRLGAALPRYRLQTGFGGCHIRELEMAKLTDPRFRRIAPKFYLTWRDDEAGIYAIVMECLDQLSHMHTVDNIAVWEPEQIQIVLRDIAAFHSVYYQRGQELASMDWLDVQTAERVTGMRDLWEALLDHNSYEYPEIFTWSRTALVQRLIAALPEIWSQLEAAPRTLVHNDFNLRNIGLRRTDGEGLRLCVYDWELATVHVPQYDVAEFLSFVLPPGSDQRPTYLDFYRRQLEQFTEQELDPGRFQAIFDLACYDLILNRFAAYSMAHTFKELSFLGRVLESHFRYLESLEEQSAGELPPLRTLETGRAS